MKKRRIPFTLVELLVAVGLLSLIMMLLLQLFSGARKIWTSNEKTNNVYADARVAMELMADLLNTVQFSHGEDDATGNRDKTKDMIFSLDTSTNSGCVIFAASAASRNLPVKNNPVCFVSFRLGDSADANTRGKLFMIVYSDRKADFYNYFPPYSSFGSSRDAAKNNLKTQMVGGYSGTAEGENEFCQVIAENVVAFKLNAYVLDNQQLVKKSASDDVAEPPHMIEIQLTVLDADSYTRWQEISDATAKSDYLKQHQRTFSRSVFIGDRWALEAQDASSGSGGGGGGGGN